VAADESAGLRLEVWGNEFVYTRDIISIIIRITKIWSIIHIFIIAKAQYCGVRESMRDSKCINNVRLASTFRDKVYPLIKLAKICVCMHAMPWIVLDAD
jgi:hypothetical protein